MGNHGYFLIGSLVSAKCKICHHIFFQTVTININTFTIVINGPPEPCHYFFFYWSHLRRQVKEPDFWRTSVLLSDFCWLVPGGVTKPLYFVKTCKRIQLSTNDSWRPQGDPIWPCDNPWSPVYNLMFVFETKGLISGTILFVSLFCTSCIFTLKKESLSSLRIPKVIHLDTDLNILWLCWVTFG